MKASDRSGLRCFKNSQRYRLIHQTFEHKIVIIFLPISLSICFGCSKEPTHPDGSFEYPQQMFWLKNRKNNFLLRTLIWGSGQSGLGFVTDIKSLLLLYAVDENFSLRHSLL